MLKGKKSNIKDANMNHHNNIKTAILEGDTIEAKGWSIKVNAHDEVEVWPPKGAGFTASLAHLDRAVSDFCRKADIVAPGVNEQQPDAVDMPKKRVDRNLKDLKDESKVGQKDKWGYNIVVINDDAGEDFGTIDFVESPEEAIKIYEDLKASGKYKEVSIMDYLWRDVTQGLLDGAKSDDPVVSWTPVKRSRKALRKTSRTFTFETVDDLHDFMEEAGISEDADDNIHWDNVKKTLTINMSDEDTYDFQQAYDHFYSGKLGSRKALRKPQVKHAKKAFVDTFDKEPDPSAYYRNMTAKKPSAELLDGIMDPEGWTARHVFAGEGIDDKKAQEDDYDLLRDVDVDGYRLRMWDAGGQRNGPWDPRTYIRYEFSDPKGNVIFSDDDFSSSPMHAIDSDESVRSLLSFLTLRPGDTDDKYFQDYTPEQMEFAESEAENLSLWSMKPEKGEDAIEFQDWKGPSGKEARRIAGPKFVYEVTENDVGKEGYDEDGNENMFAPLGVVQDIDVGKRIYENNGVYQVENAKQKGRHSQASRRTAGLKLREKWDANGGYNRDIEAESAEELHSLTRAFDGEEVDWSSFRPKKPEEQNAEVRAEDEGADVVARKNVKGQRYQELLDEDPNYDFESDPEYLVDNWLNGNKRDTIKRLKDHPELVDEVYDMLPDNDKKVFFRMFREASRNVKAVDEKAKKYWSQYMKGYGEQLTKGDVTKKKVQDKESRRRAQEDSIARQMLEKGYMYIVPIPGIEPLYTKTLQQASALLREEYPEASNVHIQKIEDFLKDQKTSRRRAQESGKTVEYYWNLGVGNEFMIEENAREDGIELDKEKWNQISDAIGQIERNAMKWLRANSSGISNEGHDSYDTLLGSLYVEEGSPQHEMVLDALEDDHEEPYMTSAGTMVIPDDVLYAGIEDWIARLMDVNLSFNIVGNRPESEDFGRGREGKRRVRRAQAAPQEPAPAAPAPQAPATPAPAAPGGAQAPAPKAPAAPKQQTMAPGTGDTGLTVLGWTPQDVAAMTDEEKQGILKIQLHKPGTRPKPEAPKPAAPKAPAPQAPPQGQPAAPGGSPAPAAPAPAPKQPVARKSRVRAQEQLPEVAPQAPAPVPGAPAAPGGAPGGAAPGKDGLSAEEQAFQILNEVQVMQVSASSPEQVKSQKSSILAQRLLREVGMTLTEAKKLFGGGSLSSLL
jgi:hypothetical protein